MSRCGWTGGGGMGGGNCGGNDAVALALERLAGTGPETGFIGSAAGVGLYGDAWEYGYAGARLYRDCTAGRDRLDCKGLIGAWSITVAYLRESIDGFSNIGQRRLHITGNKMINDPTGRSFECSKVTHLGTGRS